MMIARRAHTGARSVDDTVFAGFVLAALVVAGASLVASPLSAQDKKAAAGEQSAWVKLCEKTPFINKDKDGKEQKQEKDICLTHHERLDGNSGMVLVSAAIRKVEGSDKESLMVMVPLGMAITPGVRAAVYTPDQWQKAAKNETVDEKSLKPFKLQYTLCHQNGCTAEAPATAEMIDQLKKGGGLMVLAINAGARPIGFPVPLTGFTAAYDGKPIDNKKYSEARGKLMAQIRQRQVEAMKARQDIQGMIKEKEAEEKAAAPKK